MLAKHRRLLDKIAKIFQVAPIAFVIADFLTLPFLKWMCATATNGEVMLCSNSHNYLLHSGQFSISLVDISANSGRHLQHTFGDIVLHFSGGELRFYGINQPGRILTQVVTWRIDHLHFQFNA